MTLTSCGSECRRTSAGMRVPTLTDTFNLTDSTFCDLMTELIFVRCSVVSLADPAAPWRVVVGFCSGAVGLWAFCSVLDAPFASDLPVAAPGLLSLSMDRAGACAFWSASDLGACPVVDFESGVACPVVWGDFCSLFISGAIFSSRALLLRAG